MHIFFVEIYAVKKVIKVVRLPITMMQFESHRTLHLLTSIAEESTKYKVI